MASNNGGGCGGLIGAMLLIGLVVIVVEWLIVHWLVLVLAVAVLVVVVVAIANSRAEAARQASRWHVAHRVINNRYEIVLRQGVEEILIRSIDMSGDLSGELAEARAEARQKIDALHAHEKREAEL
jgi:c-di-AMP phosphodiesterase-like protein